MLVDCEMGKYGSRICHNSVYGLEINRPISGIIRDWGPSFMADQHCLPYGAIANFDGALQEAQSFSEKTACRGSVLDKLISPLQQIRNYYKRLSNKLRIKSSKFYLAETEIVQGENKEEQYRKIK